MITMSQTTKQNLIDEIYTETPKDYKSIIKGQKCIMFLDENGVTTLGSIELSPKFKQRFAKINS